MDDQRIIDLYFARNEQAPALTQVRYGRLCYGVAKGILSRHEDAEECVNDTLLQAWNTIPPTKPDSLPAYLCRITRNLAINRYRQSHREKREADQLTLALDELSECLSAPDEGTLDSIAIRDAMQTFLRAQSETVRNIFLQRYWYVRPIADIAAEFGMSENRVKVTLHRTRAKLRDYLRKEGIET